MGPTDWCREPRDAVRLQFADHGCLGLPTHLPLAPVNSTGAPQADIFQGRAWAAGTMDVLQVDVLEGSQLGLDQVPAASALGLQGKITSRSSRQIEQICRGGQHVIEKHNQVQVSALHQKLSLT